MSRPEDLATTPPVPLLARQAITLSLTEIALGSVVHAFKIPFGGHALSLNEAAVLTWAMRSAAHEARATARSPRRAAIRATSGVSTTAAILKSFSPAGSRLAPMLAISVQGLLFTLGVVAGGAQAFGAALGAFLLSLWGFAQPVLITGLLYGKPFFEGLLKAWTEIARLIHLPGEILFPVLGGFILLKGLLAIVITVAVWRSTPESEEAYLRKLEALPERARASGFRRPSPERKSVLQPASPLRGALHDLTSGPFVLGAAISVGFFAGSGAQGAPEIVFYALRILGMGLLLFWGLRAFPAKWRGSFKLRFPELANWIEETQRRLER